MTDPIVAIEPVLVRVSGKTIWIFVRLRTKSGLEGVGEASLNGYEAAVLAFLHEAKSWLIGQDAGAMNALASRLQMPGRGGAAQMAARSGIEQAMWDILGKRTGLPVHALLGGALRDQVPLYANVNRRADDRSPEGYARNARDAADAGFSIVKMAPFDGLTFDDGWKSKELYAAGVARIRAAAEAVGKDTVVSVDCHWRLGGGLAEHFLGLAAEMGLYWVECPLPETAVGLDALRRLRVRADQLGVRLAGMEQGEKLEDFEPFLEAGIFNVIMPDVKWCGGIGPLRDIAAAAAARGTATSPHNPSGPVCHMASLSLIATFRRSLPLEHQFDESPLFHQLVPGCVPPIKGGVSELPTAPGLGIVFDEAVLKEASIDPASL